MAYLHAEGMPSHAGGLHRVNDTTGRERRERARRHLRRDVTELRRDPSLGDGTGEVALRIGRPGGVAASGNRSVAHQAQREQGPAHRLGTIGNDVHIGSPPHAPAEGGLLIVPLRQWWKGYGV